MQPLTTCLPRVFKHDAFSPLCIGYPIRTLFVCALSAQVRLLPPLGPEVPMGIFPKHATDKLNIHQCTRTAILRLSPLVYTLANVHTPWNLEYVYVIMCTICATCTRTNILHLFVICLQVRCSGHSPPRRRHLSLTASETMFAPTAAAATNHLDRRERSLRAAAATRAASSAALAATLRVRPDVRSAKGRRHCPQPDWANTMVGAVEAARGAAAASAASAAAAGTTSAEEGGSRASSLTPRASRATAAAGTAASTRSPVTGTTRASGRGCRRLGLRVSFPCCPGTKL